MRRLPHPDDARARLIVPTERGWACTRAAEEAAADVVREWSELLGEGDMARCMTRLLRIAPYGPIRPAW